MLILFLLLLLLAFVLTYCMRLYALKTNIIDNPNERSSHSVPTPRGGGIAVVLSYLLGLVVLSYFNLISIHIGFTVILAGSVIALLGFLDDRGHINSMLRLAVHFLMAIGVVVSLNGFSGVTIFNGVQLGFIANIIAVLFLVWLLNLYNFMDGINGIASIEAITATVSMAVLYIVLNESINSNPLWSLAACVLGFLFWNFPKAKIFMGDACSGFLGFVLGIWALYALKQDPALFCAWLICLGVFIVDATFTLIRRVFNGHKMYDAHRTHAYQYASRKYQSHTVVTISVLFINMLWLLPMAYLASQRFLMPELLLLIAYIPLVLLALFFDAGKTENA